MNLQGTDNMAFALQLKVGRDASFVSVTECHAQINTTRNTVLKAWLTEAQVVAQEHIRQWSYCDSQKQMLAVILEGLPSRPHETSYVVGKGHKQYAYYARAFTHITRERTGKIEYKIEARVDN